MLVKELIEELQKLPPDTVVVMYTEDTRSFTTDISVVGGAYFQSSTGTTGIIHYEENMPERILAIVKDIAKPCCFIEALE